MEGRPAGRPSASCEAPASIASRSPASMGRAPRRRRGHDARTMTTSALTDEQQDFIAAVRDFCARELGTRDQRDALTANGRHPHNQDLYKQMAGLGWLGVAIPEEYGGSGGGMVDLCLFLEEAARGLAPIGGFGVSMITAGAYERFGTEEQKQQILGGVAEGNVEAIAMSEPGAGSDVGAVTCRAVRQNGSYVV